MRTKVNWTLKAGHLYSLNRLNTFDREDHSIYYQETGTSQSTLASRKYEVPAKKEKDGMSLLLHFSV